MLSSKLTSMSVGPLWVLRNRVAVGCCSACGNPWLQSSVDAPSVLIVLADPIKSDSEQQLFDNCLKAAGWLGKVNCFSVHATCSSDKKIAITALEEHIATVSPDKLVVWGDNVAQVSTSLFVTHTPAEMLATPALKVKVWEALCLANSSAQ